MAAGWIVAVVDGLKQDETAADAALRRAPPGPQNPRGRHEIR
ncbi:hypothetical protein [Streptomyces mirabilis]|nr:hypothetical protein [Streptomyces mirabilis]